MCSASTTSAIATKEVVNAAAMFNIFIFSVLTILSSVNFGVTAGLGLFAILAIAVPVHF